MGFRTLFNSSYSRLFAFWDKTGKYLTLEELGQLIGVKKAQISKLENSLTDARFETIIKVFKALNAKVNFKVELLNQKVKIA
jgi:HTH-type transcriptional regulator / antitoxin HipB